MSSLIQICGLPRTGTGFVSAYLSLHPHGIAYHELISKEDNYKKELERSLKKYKYVIDCSTYGFYPKHSYKESKKILITRDVKECIASSSSVFGFELGKEEFERHCLAIHNWITKNKVMIVEYKNLFKVDTLKNIWIYCFGNEDYFSEDKTNHFIGMNIQMQNPKKVIHDIDIYRIITNQLNVELCQF